MRRWLTIASLSTLISLGAAGCGNDDDGGSIDARVSDGSTASGAKPVITRVHWEPIANCTNGVRSNYTVTVTATDADTAMGMLHVTGSVPGCNGTIDAFEKMISCPNAMPYQGTVAVSDPQGNRATMSFTIRQCMDGMVP